MSSLHQQQQGRPHSIPHRIPCEPDVLSVGILPPVPARTDPIPHAVLSSDGALSLGMFKIPREMLSVRLRDTGRLTDKISRVASTTASLRHFLSDRNSGVLGSFDLATALPTFKRAMSGELRGSQFADAARAVDRLSEGQMLSSWEMSEIRSLLVDAARLATVCVGIDASYFDALCRRSSLQRCKDWLVDRAGSISLRDTRIRARLTPTMFEEFYPCEIRMDADLWAQRISLSQDGSRIVREVCTAENYVAEVLSKGALERVVRPSRGGLQGRFVVSSRQSRRPIFSVEPRISDAFAALQVGRSASRMISRLVQDRVDIVRMARLFDREAALGIHSAMARLSPQVHARLDDVDEWAARFEGEGNIALTHAERHDLAVLLLDAEICLSIAAELQSVVKGCSQRAFWRSLWATAFRDREVFRGIRLCNDLPSPLSGDMRAAVEVASNAAMLLGFSGWDRGRGPAWRIPENPLMSVTWAMHRG